MTLGFIVPFYNEGAALGNVLRKIDKLKLPGFTKCLIMVDDGSNDGAFHLAATFAKTNPNYHFIQHRMNCGKGRAIKTAVEQVDCDWYCIIDADGELDPDDIKFCDFEADVHIGYRWDSLKNKSGWYRWGNKALTRAYSVLLRFKFQDVACGFKVFGNEFAQWVRWFEEDRFGFDFEFACKAVEYDNKIGQFPVGYDRRAKGKKLHWLRDGLRALYCLWRYR